MVKISTQTLQQLKQKHNTNTLKKLQQTTYIAQQLTPEKIQLIQNLDTPNPQLTTLQTKLPEKYNNHYYWVQNNNKNNNTITKQQLQHDKELNNILQTYTNNIKHSINNTEKQLITPDPSQLHNQAHENSQQAEQITPIILNTIINTDTEKRKQLITTLRSITRHYPEIITKYLHDIPRLARNIHHPYNREKIALLTNDLARQHNKIKHHEQHQKTLQTITRIRPHYLNTYPEKEKRILNIAINSWNHITDHQQYPPEQTIETIIQYTTNITTEKDTINTAAKIFINTLQKQPQHEYNEQILNTLHYYHQQHSINQIPKQIHHLNHNHPQLQPLIKQTINNSYQQSLQQYYQQQNLSIPETKPENPYYHAKQYLETQSTKHLEHLLEQSKQPNNTKYSHQEYLSALKTISQKYHSSLTEYQQQLYHISNQLTESNNRHTFSEIILNISPHLEPNSPYVQQIHVNLTQIRTQQLRKQPRKELYTIHNSLKTINKHHNHTNTPHIITAQITSLINYLYQTQTKPNINTIPEEHFQTITQTLQSLTHPENINHETIIKTLHRIKNHQQTPQHYHQYVQSIIQNIQQNKPELQQTIQEQEQS